MSEFLILFVVCLVLVVVAVWAVIVPRLMRKAHASRGPSFPRRRHRTTVH